ncbi:hypothetical protein AB0393_28805 [Streptomyces cyaneofuscatus]|uniref:hypothetical protein n=1 Tax=Streptomyces cyaneofuscatus TaxID=66883 RepID=UPI00344D9B2E
MPPTSLDAHSPLSLHMVCGPTAPAHKTRDASTQSRPQERTKSTDQRRIDTVAYDTARERWVQLVVPPGVYDINKWWVRPLSGGDGWLAARDELEPQEASDRAE